MATAHTVHVPNSLSSNDYRQLLHTLSRHGLTLSKLVHGANSLSVIGELELLNKLLSELGHADVAVVAPFVKGQAVSRITSKRVVDKAEATSPYFDAQQLANIYQLSTTALSERTNIAIIELGGGYKQSDLDAYWEHLGLAVKPNVYALSVDGANNSPGQEADNEVVLDIEAVGGVCPNSNILVYFAPNTTQGFYNALYQAIFSTEFTPSAISISWGGPENSWGQSTCTSFSNLLQEAANKGITVCVACGDNGSGDGESGNNADFPASSPWALACGGSRLVCPSGSYDTATQETVWGGVQGDGATGGGFSSMFTRPSWQQAALASFSGGMRGLPDISADADPQTGWLIYINGGYSVIGGTSAVAPMMAGYIGALGKRVFLPYYLYSWYSQTHNIVHDIVKGSDGSWHAQTGWDPASGLGSPNGSVIAKLV